MTGDEYDAWLARVVASYTDDIVTSTGADRDVAAAQAEAQVLELLPDGTATPTMRLLTILDAESVAVGTLWIGTHPQRATAGWIFDIEVAADRRGEGLGRGAMLAAESIAAEAGWTTLGLNVFGHNPRARALYEALGYEVATTSMTKSLVR